MRGDMDVDGASVIRKEVAHRRHSCVGSSRTAVTRASARRELFLSSLTAWEIATLVRRGRLSTAVSAQALVNQLFSHPGVREVPVDREIGLVAGTLLDGFHGDPADRLIVATAIVRGLRLMTRDRRILDYARRTRAVPTIAC